MAQIDAQTFAAKYSGKKEVGIPRHYFDCIWAANFVPDFLHWSEPFANFVHHFANFVHLFANFVHFLVDKIGSMRKQAG